MKRENARIRPDYYDKFSCIADRCPITCCQEWKIAVDTETYQSWKTLEPPDTVKERRDTLSAYTKTKDEELVIALDADRRCPFLAENKLCRLVVSYGDEVLSETCTVFPREVHVFAHHEEETLMPCCPAVIDLWKTAGKVDFPEVPEGIDRSESETVLFLIRKKLLQLLQTSERTVEEILLESFYILLEFRKTDPTEEIVTEYFSKETVEELQMAVCEVEIPLADTIVECNELLQDLAVNYCREELYRGFLNPVIEEAEALLRDFDEEVLTKQWRLFVRQFKEFEPLFRCYLRNEVFSDLVMPGGNMEQSIMQLQWIAMTYTAIRQSLFLYWMKEGCGELGYETVRDYIVVISRMMGYDEEDIEEYLENSFEMLIWDWGYFALIVGR